jgi:hypothetical protein
VKTPDFDELVGAEETPEERQRLQRVHELLVSAGPPPELSPRLREAPTPNEEAAPGVPWFYRRRRGLAFLGAAAVAAIAFGIGFLVGDNGSGNFPSNRAAIAMHAPPGAGTARASITMGDRDTAGNWPMLVRVIGLKPPPEDEYYELYLTRNGKLAAYCGGFTVASRGRTTVRFSVPYKLSQTKFDGWVVTTSRKGDRQVLLTT